jgi:hypothetical protein
MMRREVNLQSGRQNRRGGTSLRPRCAPFLLAGIVGLVLWPVVFWQATPLPESGSTTTEFSEAAARSLAAKIQALSSPKPTASVPPMTITETEANSYLKVHGQEFLPPAVHDPEIHIGPKGVSSAAEVDFDQLGRLGEQSNDWGTRFVAMIFTGKQRVEATGKLESGDGHGKVTVESLNVGPTSIPAGFANFFLQSYLEKKYHIDLAKPFPLPVRVSHIILGDKVATLYFAPAKSR